jgi:hypothetical protein
MILIDTIYQRVLALANKEQRGYITPQEFNLFANQAQLEIVDSYIFDINQISRLAGNDKEYSDISNSLDEKLGVFKTEALINSTGINNITGASVYPLPVNLYQIGSVFTSGGKEYDQLSPSEFRKIQLSQFTSPNAQRPACTISDGLVHAIPSGTVTMSYLRKPSDVSWGYVVINNKALYDPNPSKTVNFELHSSEETELVYKILKLSGVSMQRQDVSGFAQGMEQLIKQQEKQ